MSEIPTANRVQVSSLSLGEKAVYVNKLSYRTVTATTGVKMQLLALGLPRCATSSLQAALEGPVLGLNPCMHMAEVLPVNARQEACIAAMRLIHTDPATPDVHREERRKLLHGLLDGYGATCDFPGNYFADDLMDMYPDAVVVLNQRASGAQWSRSWDDALAFYEGWTYFLVTLPWRQNRLHWMLMREHRAGCIRRFGVEGITGKPGAVYYERHLEWVREEARKRGRTVVEWQAKDGFAPICKALGKKVPEGEEGRFPHLNDSRNMQMIQVILVVRGLLAWAAWGGAAWAAVRYWDVVFGGVTGWVKRLL